MTRHIVDAELETFRPGNHALDFDNDGDYVEVGDVLFDGWSVFTVSAWIVPDTLGSDSTPSGHSNNEDYIVHKSGGGDDNFGLTVASGGTTLYVDDGTNNELTGSAPPTGERTHVVAVFDASNRMAIYLDGAKDTETSFSGSSLIDNGNPVQIGGRSDITEWFDGRIDDLRVYNRVLSDAEIQDLADAAPVDDTDLVGWWRFDDGEGSTATDESGSGNDGTLNGDPQWVVGIAPDRIVPASHIGGAGISPRLGNLIDTGSFTIDNDGGRYTGDITSGDRLRFFTQLAGETSLTHRWTGVARSIAIEQTGPATDELTINVDDFVFGVLADRYVVNGFDGDPLAGTSDSVLNTILENEAPEVDRSGISTISDAVEVVYNGRELLEAVRGLADRADAVVSQRDRTIHFDRLGDLTPDWTLKSADKGLHTVDVNDDDLENEVRVEGGVATAIDSQQTTQSSTTRVDSSTRITHQLSTRKAELAQIEVYTKTTGSGDNVVVRLQSDDGGAPVAPGSRQSDIARKTLSSHFIASDGYTTFLMPDHSFPDPNPWLIIESDGGTGQDIGVDSNGNPAYKAHYPYPLSTVARDRDSIEKYRRRENIVRREVAKTREQVKDVALARLRHHDEPARRIEFPAQSTRAHNLKPGDVIYVDEPDYDFVGDAVVVEKRDEYDGTRLRTEIVAQEAATV